MLSVQTLARRIRPRLHDKDDIEYDDEQILDCINNGVRFIRRIIADTRPALLMTEHEGVLEAGTRSVVLDKRPTKIVEVTAGDRIVKTEVYYTGKKIYHDFDKIFRNHNPIYNRHEKHTYSEQALHYTEMSFIAPRPSDATGTPRAYFLTGSQTLNFFPTPNQKTKYTVYKVDDIDEIEWSGSSPLLSEFDDFLVEYVAIRLSVGNEFDMSQESQLLANITAQIQALLVPPPAGILTRGYWDSRWRKAGGWR